MSRPKNQAVENFESALNKLREFTKAPIKEDRDKAGIIQAFEFSFELAWKAVQKLAVTHNKSIGSPKQAFQAAFELGWIAEGEHDGWINMIADRNLTSHTYKEDIADAVLRRINDAHIALLGKLLIAVKNESQV